MDEWKDGWMDGKLVGGSVGRWEDRSRWINNRKVMSGRWVNRCMGVLGERISGEMDGCIEDWMIRWWGLHHAQRSTQANPSWEDKFMVVGIQILEDLESPGINSVENTNSRRIRSRGCMGGTMCWQVGSEEGLWAPVGEDDAGSEKPRRKLDKRRGNLWWRKQHRY